VGRAIYVYERVCQGMGKRHLYCRKSLHKVKKGKAIPVIDHGGP
jgi:hypothetical protein